MMWAVEHWMGPGLRPEFWAQHEAAGIEAANALFLVTRWLPAGTREADINAAIEATIRTLYAQSGAISERYGISAPAGIERFQAFAHEAYAARMSALVLGEESVASALGHVPRLQ